MKVLEYLNGLTKAGASCYTALGILQENYGIKFSENKEYGLFVLNYDQIDSHKHKFEQIVRECRSLVLRVVKSKGLFNTNALLCEVDFEEFKVVSRSFDRFFNYTEEFGSEYDLTKLVAHEKMDGSLVSLFNYKGEWLYRTKSMIMPDTKVNGFETTWKELIEEALGNYKESVLMTQSTYIFEVTSPTNRVVTRYEKPEVTLLATRDYLQGSYLPDDYTDACAEFHGWNRPRTWTFNNWKEVLQGAKDLPNLEEGYVMYHKEFHSPVMKCKNPAYVAAHHLRGEGLNPKRCWDLVLMNETDEYLGVFPEDVNTIQPFVVAYETAIASMVWSWEKHKDISTQKGFALAVKDLPFTSVLFSMRKGLTLQQAWDKLTTNAKYKLLNVFLQK